MSLCWFGEEKVMVNEQKKKEKKYKAFLYLYIISQNLKSFELFFK